MTGSIRGIRYKYRLWLYVMIYLRINIKFKNTKPHNKAKILQSTVKFVLTDRSFGIPSNGHGFWLYAQCLLNDTGLWVFDLKKKPFFKRKEYHIYV